MSLLILLISLLLLLLQPLVIFPETWCYLSLYSSEVAAIGYVFLKWCVFITSSVASSFVEEFFNPTIQSQRCSEFYPLSESPGFAEVLPSCGTQFLPWAPSTFGQPCLSGGWVFWPAVCAASVYPWSELFFFQLWGIEYNIIFTWSDLAHSSWYSFIWAESLQGFPVVTAIPPTLLLMILFDWKSLKIGI